MNTTKRILCLSLLLTASTCLQAQVTSLNDTEKSCRAFVEGFYHWYAAKAFAAPEGWLQHVLRQRRSAFSPELLRALEEYSAAPTGGKNEIEGLDFDPFLNAQDVADTYLLRNVTQTANTCRAEVYSVLSGKHHVRPDVIPELVWRHGRWVFVNFHYPNRSRQEFDNLLDLLKSFRSSRPNDGPPHLNANVEPLPEHAEKPTEEPVLFHLRCSVPPHATGAAKFGEDELSVRLAVAGHLAAAPDHQRQNHDDPRRGDIHVRFRREPALAHRQADERDIELRL